ncbi:uncharacterized protein LOC143294239 [Babylonia areolata]|uniref:uncharacterized protein LOC143294239 n=1 Tax=Babylonia areolata TaxID=304850 RepID=UPI003FD27530
MEEETDPASETLVWKEPVNGKRAFFTEEVYQQLAGPEPSLEDRVMRMMDALGFPPPSKLAARGPGHADAPGLDSCSQDSRSSCGTEPAEVKVEDAESSSGPDPACGGAGTESKEDCRSKPCETTAVPHAALRQENSQDGGGEGVRLEPNAGPQTDLCVSVPHGATTASLGQDDGSAGLGADVVSGRVWRGKGNNPVWRGKGDDAEGDHQTAGSSADQTLPEGPVRRDGSAMDAQGQTRSAHRGKMHEKGRRPPVPEAPKSSLLHEQHLRYLHLFQKCTQKFFSGIATRPTPDELKELQEFESLQLMVCQEQEQCQNHLKQVATCNSYLYTHLPSHAAQYIQEREERGWRRVENYCRYYAAHSQLSLVPDMSQPVPGATPLPALTLLNTLLELGSKCKVVMPDMNPHPSARVRRTVCTDLHKVTARFPNDRPSNPLTWNHEPASKDSNLEGLVHKYPCHIATSASVLQQLIDNHAPDFAVAWDIPVVVKDYGNGSASQRVVYLDKPLQPAVFSLCQRKGHYLKKAVRAFICQPHNERRTVVGGQGRRGMEEQPPEGAGDSMEGSVGHSRGVGAGTEEDDDPFGSVSMEHLETFGSDRLASDGGSRRVGGLKGGGGGGGRQDLGNRVSGSSASQLLTVAPKMEVVEESGDSQTCGNASDSDVTVMENSTDVRQEAEDTDIRSSAETKAGSPVGAQTPGGKYHLRSAGKWDPGVTSDSDDDNALVIADVSSPLCSQAGATTPPHQRTTHTHGQDFGAGICVDASASTPTDCFQGQGHTTALSPARRITRSLSHRLQSPEAAGERSGCLGDSDVGHTSALPCDSDGAMGSSASPRTRQGLKRRGAAATGTSTVCEEGAQGKRGRRGVEGDGATVMTSETNADRTQGKAAVGQSTGPCLAPSLPARQNKGTGKQSTETAPSYLDSLLKEMTPLGLTSKVTLQEDPGQYKHPGCSGEHVSYQHWNLGGMALIVRCNGHAFIRDIRQQSQAVYVSAKAERQIPHGLEQNTLSECVRGWLGCYLRPNSFLLRARVNMQNYEVVHTEQLQLNQILQPSLNFSPHCAFAVLNNIFTRLTELPAGSYLLSHEAGSSTVQLKSGTSVRRGSHDLRSHYMGLMMQEADKSVPWVPVDPTLMLPHHWRMGLIPATFQPPDKKK